MRGELADQQAERVLHQRQPVGLVHGAGGVDHENQVRGLLPLAADDARLDADLEEREVLAERRRHAFRMDVEDVARALGVVVVEGVDELLHADDARGGQVAAADVLPRDRVGGGVDVHREGREAVLLRHHERVHGRRRGGRRLGQRVRLGGRFGFLKLGLGLELAGILDDDADSRCLCSLELPAQLEGELRLGLLFNNPCVPVGEDDELLRWVASWRGEAAAWANFCEGGTAACCLRSAFAGLRAVRGLARGVRPANSSVRPVLGSHHSSPAARFTFATLLPPP